LSDNNEIFRFGDPKTPIIISESIFNGIRGLDIRKYYFDKKSGEIKPTSKGIWLREVEFKEIVKFILENKEKIENFYTDNIDNVEKINRGKNLKNNAIRNELNKVDSIEVKKDYWPGGSFYDINHQGNNHEISLNGKFKFFDNLNNDQINKVSSILYTYEKAKNLIESNDKSNILNLLELEWSNQVRQLD